MIFGDKSTEDQLDDFALLACQSYNLGNAGNWFFSFRGGLQGLRSRRAGLSRHYCDVYQWRNDTYFGNFEHHISVMLFCMDSALECLVFALNAMGQALPPQGFRDVRDEKELRRISLGDVVGSSPRSGWARLFPTFQQHLRASSNLISLVTENHDVSKHRQHSFSGGRTRTDAPAGYFASRGVAVDNPQRFQFSPMASVMIPKEPKLPMEVRPSDLAAWTTLEALVENFGPFMDRAIEAAFHDAKANITLPVGALRASEATT